jgi:HK97 gp10 family phage protein
MATAVGGIKLDTKRLDEIARKLDTNADGALRKISAQVEGLAKTLAPVDTSALRNSIHFEKISEGLYWVEDGVEYGIYQELGTYKMRAHPFMIPAAEHVSNQIGAIFQKELFK